MIDILVFLIFCIICAYTIDISINCIIFIFYLIKLIITILLDTTSAIVDWVDMKIKEFIKKR